MNEYLIPLFQEILKMSAYAAVAALLVIAIRFFLRKKLPAWFSYALWGIVLLRLILPVGILSSSISLFNLEKPLRNLPGVVQGATTTNAVVDTTSVTPSETIEKETTAYVGEPASVQVRHEIPIMVMVAVVWLTGIVIFMLFATVSHILTLRRLQSAIKLSQTDLLTECAKNVGLKRRVRLVSSDLYGSPVVCGLFHPRIILPVNLTDAAPDTLRAILTHELIHIKRFDLLWNLIGTIVLAVHWFNPMVWISAVLSRRDRERSCDERTLSILGDNKQYAETLLTISALQSGKNTPIGALAFGEEGVKNRIKSALSFRKKSCIIIALSVVVLVILSVTLVTAAADRRISISKAESIVMKDLRATNPNINPEATIELEEFGNDEIFRATGYQIFKIVGEFHLNEAFFIKDGLVEHTVPGFGGYGINDLHLTDFNGDGQKELLYTYTYGSGMMQSNIGFYDPWERSSSSHGIWYTGTMTLGPVSDNEFTLLDTEGKPIGSVIGSWDGERNSINVTTVYGSDDPQLYVSAWPNPYSPFMSYSPGMRLDISYSSLSTGVRYRAENGSFVSWEDSIVTDLGKDTIQITGHEVYWRPSPESADGDTVTITILYRPYQPDNVLAETMLPIIADGSDGYYIGEGAQTPQIGNTALEERLSAIPQNEPWDAGYYRNLNEYENILKYHSEDALDYFLSQFEAGNAEGFRGYVMMWLCQDLLGEQNNVVGEYSPQEWYARLSIVSEIKLPDYKPENPDGEYCGILYSGIVQHFSQADNGFVVASYTDYGAYEENEKLKIFVTVYYSRYKLYGKTLVSQSGGTVPCALTFSKDEHSGGWALADYTEIGVTKGYADGAYFFDSIRKMCVMPDSSKEIPDLADAIIKGYPGYDILHELHIKNLKEHLLAYGQTDVSLKAHSGELTSLT